jgi:hypothetical protein
MSIEKLVVVFAGTDLYRLEKVQDVQHYISYLLTIVQEEFGAGAELIATGENKFEISVEKVKVA